MKASVFRWLPWCNPLFRRYCRARLRPGALSAWLLIVLLISGFFFFVFRTVALYQMSDRLNVVSAERVALLPLLAIQAFILFFLGTGQVAGGMTAEADEGVLDYQRLTPLSPLTKVLGYLLGLPIREYVLFLATLPFTAWALWKGQVPVHAWASLYLVLLCSTLLYHFTALVAGTVIKNRRWAFLASIGLVFLLYTVVPQVAKFGLTSFKYFTIWPVFEENLGHFLPQEAGRAFGRLRAYLATPRFFDVLISETKLTLLSQSGLIATFFMILWRRWRRADAHVLGKLWALGLMAWLHLMLLGHALPLIESGIIFPGKQLTSNPFLHVMLAPHWRPTLAEASLMSACYGQVTFWLLLVLLYIITPSLDTQMRGRRRQAKLGLRHLPLFSDEASSWWCSLVLAALGTLGWHTFLNALIDSQWFLGVRLSPLAPVVLALPLFTGAITFQIVLERYGGKAAFLALIFLGFVPPMAAGVLAAADLPTAAIWLALASPFGAVPAASQWLLPDTELSLTLAQALPSAFWFWQLLWLLLTFWLVRHNRRPPSAAPAITEAFSHAPAPVSSPWKPAKG